MGNEETALQQRIRLALGAHPWLRLFRNTVGSAKTAIGNWVVYGLGPGTSDIVGWSSVVVTPEMVGKRVALFVAVEVKVPGAYTDAERLAAQKGFVDIVLEHGGRAGFADNIKDATDIVMGTGPGSEPR